MNQFVAKPSPADASVGFARLAERLREVSHNDSLAGFTAKHLKVACRFWWGRYLPITLSTPRLASRYTRKYLALSADLIERRTIFVHHYRLLLTGFSDAFISDLSRNEVCLWEHAGENDRYAITMGLDRSMHGEGDLVMYFRHEGKVLFDLSFTIAPAQFTQGSGESTLLIARVQGRPDMFEEIRRATKACGDIFPGQLLLSAAEGVARALSISSLCGVRGEEQLSSRWGGGRFNYDVFWSDHHGERRGSWYCMSVPLPHKPLAEVSATHRRRAKRKRLFKDALSDRVKASIAAGLRPAR